MPLDVARASAEDPSVETSTDAGAAAMLDEIERAVVELTNALRAEHGLAPLAVDMALSQAAESHSRDMADNEVFGHRGSDGEGVGARVRAAGYDWAAVGENIAAGQDTPAEVVNAWFASPGHRANILSDDFTAIGVGFVADTDGDGYGEYWTQVFAATPADLFG